MIMHLKGGPCAWEPQTREEREVTCAMCRGWLLEQRERRQHRNDDLVPAPVEDSASSLPSLDLFVGPDATGFDSPSPDFDGGGYTGGGGESGGGGASGEW
jgi:uncharacterized membrane protein YgcG